MKITITTTQLLKVLYIFAWIIFIGVSIDAGGFIVSAFYTLFVNPVNAKTTWPGIDFSALYTYDHGHFIVQMTYMTIVAMLKATQFYLVIKLLQDKKFDFQQTFSKETARLIFHLSYLSIGAGLFSSWGAKYAFWLAGKGIPMPDTENMRLGGADVWLYMGAMLFIIGQVFKRGIEIQSENDLTV